ncbi:MAG: hypothetical protein LJE64_04960 [Desulfofustis sp.]|jgi:hypothetical protein|nr:hypothetical protein [Desulfofustis sp.]
MTGTMSFDHQVELLKQEVKNLGDGSSDALIEETAQRLERLNYAPPVIIPMDRFLRLTSDSMLQEIDRILEMSDQEACALAPDNPKKCQELRLEILSVQVFYYKNLIQLRRGDLDMWDEIDELYVHD